MSYMSMILWMALLMSFIRFVKKWGRGLAGLA